jgi:hypothetical protein
VLAKDFTEHIERAHKEALDYFDEKVKASILPGDICEWNYSMPLEELRNSITAETEHFSKELLQLLMTNAKDELEVNLRSLSLLPHFLLIDTPFLESPSRAFFNKRPIICGVLSATTSRQLWKSRLRN